MRQLVRNTVFFLGWLLSPLTFWNDAFINIPISYTLASLLIKIVHVDFLTLVLIFYWITNGIGLCMMYLAGKDMVRHKAGLIKQVFSLIITTTIYSLIIIALCKIGFLKPL